MNEFRWYHIRERLPAFRKRVVVASHKTCDPRVAWRTALGGGAWEWDTEDERTEVRTLTYWAHIPALPEKLSFMEERRLGPPHDENEDSPPEERDAK